MSTHPISAIFWTRSRRFTPPPTRLPFELPERAHLTNPRTDRANARGDPPGTHPGSGNRDTHRDNRARNGHLANKRTEDLSCREITPAPEPGQRLCFGRTFRISDPAPLVPSMKQQRYRGVRCIRLVRRRFDSHLFANRLSESTSGRYATTNVGSVTRTKAHIVAAKKLTHEGRPSVLRIHT